jgi:hypothetical protein
MKGVKMAKYKITSGEIFWYYIVNIFTFASLYFIKTAVKKALSEEQ